MAERTWAPGVVNALHTHPLSVKAQIVHCDMWLTVAGTVRHLHAVDSFELVSEELYANASAWSFQPIGRRASMRSEPAEIFGATMLCGL